MANCEINELLAKVNAKPFYFGGDNESYFWRVGRIEDADGDEIFAERVFGYIDSSAVSTYYYASCKDRSAMDRIYESFVIDFVMYYYDDWRCGCADDIFDVVASPNDEGLNEILGIFHIDKVDEDHTAQVPDL